MSHLTTGTTPAELFLKPQLRTRLRCIKPNLREYVEGKQQKMKDQHDGRNSQMREFQKEDQVQVKTTVPGQKWKWVSGVIHRRLGPLTYLVRVGKRIRYCHADHPLTSSAILLERDPTLQPLDLSSLSMKKPVPNDIPVLSASSGQPEEEPGEPSLEDVTDKLEKPYAERGNETPELVNQPSKRRYPDRIRKPTINWTCKSFVLGLYFAGAMTLLSVKVW